MFAMRRESFDRIARAEAKLHLPVFVRIAIWLDTSSQITP